MDINTNASHKIDNLSHALGDNMLYLPQNIVVATFIAITVHFLLSVVLNSFNIVVLRRGDCGFEHRARQFGMALAVIDQLDALVSFSYDVMRITIPEDILSCVYMFLLKHTLSTLSQVYMSGLSGDRFLRIWKPFLYERLLTNTAATRTFTLVTFICLAFGIGQLVSWKHNPTVINECSQGEGVAAGEKTWMLLIFFLPVCSLANCTITQVGTLFITFNKIRAETRLRPHFDGNFLQVVGERGQFRARYLKGIRTVLILILSTYVVTLPSVIVRVVRDLSDQGNVLFMAFQLMFVTVKFFIQFIFLSQKMINLLNDGPLQQKFFFYEISILLGKCI